MSSVRIAQPQTTAANHPTNQPNQRSLYEDARSYARLLGNAELLNDWSSFAYSGEPDGEDTDPVLLALDGARFRAFDEELRRRERLAEQDSSLPNPRGINFDKWRICADEIRGRCDVPDFCQRLGIDLKPVGSNSTRGQREFAGPCPVCGGHDRLRSWSGPRGRIWCRQCPVNMDAIGIAEVFTYTYELSFFDAVRHLCDFFGFDPPEEDLPANISRRRRAAPIRQTGSVRIGR